MAKAHFIKAYFEDLQSRIAFLVELHETRRRNEALMLCCCYIEALGSRLAQEPERKAKSYCTVLAEHGQNDLWQLIHPRQLRQVISENGLFKKHLSDFDKVLDTFGKQLIHPEELRSQLEPHMNAEQRRWLQDNLFKGSLANISYERIRSELVHDISAAPLSFSETTYKGEPVPDLDFAMLHTSLRHIVNFSQEQAISKNKWWYE